MVERGRRLLLRLDARRSGPLSLMILTFET